MTRHRLHTRARGNRRYVPRHAAWSRFRSVDAHVAAALSIPHVERLYMGSELQRRTIAEHMAACNASALVRAS